MEIYTCNSVKLPTGYIYMYVHSVWPMLASRHAARPFPLFPCAFVGEISIWSAMKIIHFLCSLGYHRQRLSFCLLYMYILIVLSRTDVTKQWWGCGRGRGWWNKLHADKSDVHIRASSVCFWRRLSPVLVCTQALLDDRWPQAAAGEDADTRDATLMAECGECQRKVSAH